MRRKHQLVIGEANAERIKIEAGSASRIINGETAEIFIRGREIRQGKPKTVVLGPHDIAEALEGTVEQIAEFIQHGIEDLPAEISTDICERGIHLSGGGAKLVEARSGAGSSVSASNSIYLNCRNNASLRERRLYCGRSRNVSIF